MASNRPHRAVRNCINYVDSNDSDCDINFYSSSDDEDFNPVCEDGHDSSTDSDDSDDAITLAALVNQRKTSAGESSDDDNIPLSRLQKTTESSKKSAKAVPPTHTWKRKCFVPPSTEFKGESEGPPPDGKVLSPYTYFKQLVTDEMLINIEEQTNLYSLQKDGIQINTTKRK